MNNLRVDNTQVYFKVDNTGLICAIDHSGAYYAVGPFSTTAFINANGDTKNLNADEMFKQLSDISTGKKSLISVKLEYPQLVAPQLVAPQLVAPQLVPINIAQAVPINIAQAVPVPAAPQSLVFSCVDIFGTALEARYAFRQIARVDALWIDITLAISEQKHAAKISALDVQYTHRIKTLNDMCVKANGEIAKLKLENTSLKGAIDAIKVDLAQVKASIAKETPAVNINA